MQTFHMLKLYDYLDKAQSTSQTGQIFHRSFGAMKSGFNRKLYSNNSFEALHFIIF